MSLRMRRGTTGVAVAVLLAMTFSAGPAFADGADVSPTATQVESALLDEVPAVAGTAVRGAATDADSAIVLSTPSASIDVPRDPASPVTIDAPDAPPITIGLADPGLAQDAVSVASGAVVYQGTDPAVSTAVQVAEDGSARFLTVLSGPSAPTAYDYDLGLPDGSSVVLGESGDVGFVDASGSFMGSVAAPWATDAAGRALPAWFTGQGTTLTLHVDTTGAAFPVVVDPWYKPWTWGSNKGFRGCVVWGVGGAIAGASGGWVGAGLGAVGGCGAGAVSAYWH
jgi:hypothetical protein